MKIRWALPLGFAIVGGLSAFSIGAVGSFVSGYWVSGIICVILFFITLWVTGLLMEKL